MANIKHMPIRYSIYSMYVTLHVSYRQRMYATVAHLSQNASLIVGRRCFVHVVFICEVAGLAWWRQKHCLVINQLTCVLAIPAVRALGARSNIGLEEWRVRLGFVAVFIQTTWIEDVPIDAPLIMQCFTVASPCQFSSFRSRRSFIAEWLHARTVFYTVSTKKL